MANYNKSFNFRNGVQVDSDKFIVNASGAVGIGTSIPTAQFDLYGGSKLRGDVNITGLVTSTQAYVSGVSTFNDVRIGTGITIEASTGIITAKKFYGDGSTLDNVTSISVAGWEINTGLAGTTSSVGVGTTNPGTKLQVWHPDNASYTPNANITNLVQIYNVDKTKNDTFAGLTLGSLNDDEQLAVYNIACVSESAARKGSLIIQSRNTDDTYTEKLRINPDGYVGIGTTEPSQPIDVIGKIKTEELEVTKISSFNQRVGLTTSLQVGGDANVVGYTTTGDAKIADLKIEIKSRTWPNDSWTGSTTGVQASSIGKNIIIQAGGAQTTRGFVMLENTGPVYIGGGTDGVNGPDMGLNLVGMTTAHGDVYMKSNLDVTGVSTFSDTITTPTLTADKGYIGVNTAGISTVSIGQSVGVGRSTGLLRFGSANGTFEVLNNDTGDLVFGIHSGDVAGINTGDFKWIHKTSNNLMTLTGIGGSLGINQEDPEHPLHVSGSSTITGAAWFGNNVNVKNNINCDGVITGSFTLQNPITSNVNSTGISTVGGLHIVGGSTNTLGVGTYTVTTGSKLEVQGGAVFPDTGVGINTNKVDSEYALSVRGDMKVNKLTGWTKEGIDSAGVTLQHSDNDKITTTNTGAIITGICTATDFEGAGATAADFPKGLTGIAVTATGNLTVGTHIANGAGVNLATAGAITKRFMVLPTVTTTQRDALTNTVAGALVYNSSTNKLNFYTGSAWEVVTSS